MLLWQVITVDEPPVLSIDSLVLSDKLGLWKTVRSSGNHSRRRIRFEHSFFYNFNFFRHHVQKGFRLRAGSVVVEDVFVDQLLGLLLLRFEDRSPRDEPFHGTRRRSIVFADFVKVDEGCEEGETNPTQEKGECHAVARGQHFDGENVSGGSE